MKKIWKMMLAASVLSMTGCSSAGGAAEMTTAPETSSAATVFNPGTYTGEAMGHGGPVAVEVTVSEDAITDIKVTAGTETSGIGDVAAAHVIEDVLSRQSLDVDHVTGCTISAAAYKTAVEIALSEAGADIGALKNVEKPAVEATSETLDVDVAIIGSGAAGLMAAIEAQNAGAKVVVLEKLSRNGGSTRVSSGMIVAGGTSLQEAAGIEDSTQNLKDYWIERGEGNVDVEMVDFVADHINECLEYFMSIGVDYNQNLILQSGTATINRAHMPSGTGAQLCDQLVSEVEKNGGEVRTETNAVSLIQDEDGTVTGVNCETKTGTLTVNAGAVVIATGGYGWNEELIGAYSPNAAGAWSMSSPGSTGDGLIMAMDAGADTVFKGGFIGWKVCTPAYDHTTAIGAPIYGAANLIVNTNGDRFCNEALDYPFVYNAMEEDGSDTFYWLFETGNGETTDLVNNVSNTVANLELGVAARVVYKGETIEELAEVSGLKDLVQSVEAWNAAIDAGEDTEFGRDISTMSKLENGPFYAIRSQRATLGTFGGINTNVTGEVVDADENAIAGLYAAGEVANGEFFPVIYPASGSSVSMCVVLGKEAGKSAAAYALNK